MRSAPITLEQPVGDDQGRPPDHQAIERGLDRRLVLGVDRRQRFVEQQDRRVAQQRARDREALALAAGEPHAAFADRGIPALRAARR
jgi:hypothetical protein